MINYDTEIQHPILSASTPELFKFLQQVDPLQAGRLHPSDRRKILGKVELYLRTGRPASELFQQQKDGGVEARWDTLIFWIWSERDVLNGRLDRRVDKMIELGVERECKELYGIAQKTGIPITSGIFQAIGNPSEAKADYRISRVSSCCNCWRRKRYNAVTTRSHSTNEITHPSIRKNSTKLDKP
jgi:tRNA dimethylallyltransferase